MKLTYALKVLMSCKNIDHMSTVILWASRILEKEDSKRFWHVAQHLPNFDLAVQDAKQKYMEFRRFSRL